jgi:uncharacterized protein (TIGR02145 family)
MKKQFLPVIFTSLLYVSGIFLNTSLHAQTVIGGSTPDPSAELDVQSGNRGLLPPRLTTSQRDAIISPATGLLVFNTTRNCVEMNTGTPSIPVWSCMTMANTVTGPSATPSVCQNTALTPVTHATTGATGIGTATGLPSGVTAAWASNTITISGTPTVAGTFNYSIPLTGGLGAGTATGTITVMAPVTVGAASSAPMLLVNTAMTDITHSTTMATGIGTPANLPPGVTASWASSTITISGTPTVAGTYNYSIPLTGCGNVSATGTIIVTPTVCGAFIAANVWKTFQCHNLGADESADPFTPSWRLNGNYYQWGRSPIAANGPTGPDASQANSGTVTGWNTTPAADGSWTDAGKTVNDPCPSGFRVPTQAQWINVASTTVNPIQSRIGTWTVSVTNYSSGWRIGTGNTGLFLPTPGSRNSNSNSSLSERGGVGLYWATTPFGAAAYCLRLNSSISDIISSTRTTGLSIRCIEE